MYYLCHTDTSRVIKKKKQLTRSDRTVDTSMGIISIVYQYRKTQFTMGGTIPAQGVLSCIKKSR